MAAENTQLVHSHRSGGGTFTISQRLLFKEGGQLDENMLVGGHDACIFLFENAGYGLNCQKISSFSDSVNLILSKKGAGVIGKNGYFIGCFGILLGFFRWFA